MNSKRLFYGLVGVLLVVVALFGGSVYLGWKHLDKQTSKLSDLKVEASVLQDTQRSLAKAKKDIVTYADIEQVTKTVIPQEKDQARTVREIVKIANDNNIAIASIGFPASTLGSKPATGAGPSTATPGVNTQTQKVEGINNVEKLEIIVMSESAKPALYTDFIAFLSDLEKNRRTAQVTNISIQPVSDNRNRLSFSLNLNVYIKK